MIVAILMLSMLDGNRWSWEAAEGADSYNLYWSSRPDCWYASQSVNVPAQIDSTTGAQYPVQIYDDLALDGLVRPVAGQALYFVVTSLNAAGESDTEHGSIFPLPAGVCE